MTRTEISASAVREIGLFLAEYSALLFRSGATCIRLEKNLKRMALNWSLDVSVTILPSRIHLELTDSDGKAYPFETAIGKSSINFNIITRLSRLSWRVADTSLSLETTRRLFDIIRSTPPASGLWVLFAASCANSAFCRLFGGDFMAMSVVFCATLGGYYLKQIMLAAAVDIRLVFTACAFVSSVLAASGYLFSLGQTPDVAIATSVLYLVPGIPFLNAFSDMTDGHYISCLTRLTDAVILTCCLSAGLCLGMKLMNVGMF